MVKSFLSEYLDWINEMNDFRMVEIEIIKQ